jgi:hypothetical protein
VKAVIRQKLSNAVKLLKKKTVVWSHIHLPTDNAIQFCDFNLLNIKNYLTSVLTVYNRSIYHAK